MGRAPCCEKVGLNKGRWTAEEDDILTKFIQANGEGSWRSLPKNAGLVRCGKSCRLRWINYLKADLKRGNITSDDEQMIVKLQAVFGNRWSLIAEKLPGRRTDNEIKNYWNSHLRRKIYTVTQPSNMSSSPAIRILDIPPVPRRRRAATIKEKITIPPHMEKEEIEEGLNSKHREEDHSFSLENNDEVLSPIIDEGDREDLGTIYDWLDGEIMRLNNEIIEQGMVGNLNGNYYRNNENVTCGDDGPCSSSMNSALEIDQWLNFDWEDGSVEGCLDQRELEEISSWLLESEID